MSSTHEIRPEQSIELLKALHILTRDGKMNQDSRRKLKQVYHLFQFIEPLLTDLKQGRDGITLVDHGSGKSYLGFILYDLFFKRLKDQSRLYGIETREELVKSAADLLIDRLLRVSLAPSAREARVTTLENEWGTATLAEAETYAEYGLRVVAHLIMSSPQYQLA